ncbi:ABC transporter ATP-binding protein [Geitlerinema sp. PCC 7407]|uniref:ABC transporter ATP-binding protein n=1 Tax=Geitlerinema sp. PCC 7407 TaxID=1173025 RepID=UPI00029FD40B|nr:ABC transporter ATP-binding protein [Geitlerinema sp. PCC 7407]AFY68315.1 ABC transporter related protein [Geitlerinema sp. PCC 7407]
MTDTVLNVRNLKVEFVLDSRRVQAVDDISFQVQRGQTLGIVGESGSGKSVTALALLGLVPSPGRVTSGEILFQGSSGEPINLRSLSEEQRQQYRGGEVAMIFQEPLSSLNPVFTCGYQLTEAILQHHPLPKAEAERRAIALLQEVKLLASDEDLAQRLRESHTDRPPSEQAIAEIVEQQKQALLQRYPHELSGGQLQRVMIAMALAGNPSLLIADEPTTALDVTVQARILDLLRELRDRRGMSIIFVTHDLGLIADIADSIAVMYQGKLVELGSVWDIFSQPQHPYTKGLLTCRPRPDRRLRRLPTVADFMETVTTPDGHLEIREKSLDVETALHQDDISDAEVQQRLADLGQRSPLIAVRNLKVGFPVKGLLGTTQRYTMAVNDVSFDIYPGETLGLVGESGCGKTTLARTLLRLVQPMSGQIVFEGRDVLTLEGKALQEVRRNMQIVFQDPFSSLDPRMSIGAAIVEPLRIHGIHRRHAKPRQHLRERAAYLLDKVGLEPAWMNRYPHEFSGGQRQRICIARALALNPQFIICDESVSALDVSVQAQVLNLLKALQSEFGLTYIFISHDLSVVKFMSDRIMVMNRGRIEEIGPADSIYREPKEAYTRQLISAIPVGSLEQIRDRQAQRGTIAS